MGVFDNLQTQHSGRVGQLNDEWEAYTCGHCSNPAISRGR
jgi:hypothetical protein